MSYSRKTFAVLCVLLVAMLCGCAPEPDDGHYVLTYASPYPATHPFSRADLRWIKFVEERSAGRVQVRPFWGGSLLSSDQSVLEIRHGVADIGLITPIYMRGGMHASRAQAGFYGGVRSMEDQVAIFKCLARDFPVFIDELRGLHVLALQGGNFSGVLTRSRPVRSLADLRGLRLRAQSESIDVLRRLGADPVDMPMSEVYSALAKGVIDGVVAPPDALRSVHLAEVGAYFTELQFSRGSYPARAISQRTWLRLPDDLRTVLVEGQPVWEHALIEEIQRGQKAGYEFAAQRGVELIPVDAAEQQRFDVIARQSAEHRAQELQEYGIDGEAILRRVQELVHVRSQGAALDCPAAIGGDSRMSGPLDGVRVADFSWVGAGPRATKDLADYGATVIKIESRQRLDLGRLSPPFKDDVRDADGSAFFAIANTSKLSVTINLADPRGVAVAKRLVQWSDVVVENFGKGYMERIGLSPEVLTSLRPDLIQVSVSVAGRTGPNANLRGYGNSAAALSGLAALSGWPDRPPHMPPFAYGDVVAPIFATIAVLAALEHRRQTGQGQCIDVSQVEPLVHVLSDCFVESQRSGTVSKPGNRSRSMAPHGVYPCRGEDQWCAIAIRSDREWSLLCDAMRQATLGNDPRFMTLADRKAHEDELDAIVAAWSLAHDKHELADRLARVGIAAEAVNDGRDVFNDPELTSSGHYARTHHSVLGDCLMPGPPVRFSENTVEVRAAPLLGEHNRVVFIEMLGMSEREVADLVASGALS